MSIQPGPGYTFASSSLGTNLSIQQPWSELGGSNLLQQFEIVAQPQYVAGVKTEFTIIRVVKGEVVWSPKLKKESILPTNSCTSQTTIENWFALPTFPIIDDDKAVFIGDGGIRVPTAAGLTIGIFIFKATNLTFDPDPIIVAAPDFVPSCPVVFPGDSPFLGASWDVVKIGSAFYIAPNPEADPPVKGGWQITQNFIGSMTLPGDGRGEGTTETIPFPPQLPATQTASASRPAPFECRIDVDSSGDMLLRIGNGSVSYTKSDMPFISIQARNANRFQAEYLRLQAVPSGWRKEGGDDLAWMEIGGGYKITGEGQWYLVAFHWDATEANGFILPAAVKSGRPAVALIDAQSADVDKLFVETGPGLYTNTMNIQRMSGYTSAETEEPWDWGYCHTTYFNPIKFGYDIKMIARIESQPADPAVTQVSVYQLATTTRNQIQNIYFPVIPKDGFVTFTYTDPVLGSLTSGQFFPAPWSGFNDATNLFNALQQITPLKGNIAVTRTSDHNFYVTFINALQATNVPTLVATSSLQSWPNIYVIDQYHTGNLVLDAGPRFDGTQIMNKEGVTQAQDPYVLQETAATKFNKVVNRADLMACAVSGDTNFTAGIIPLVDNDVPRGVTEHSWVYGVANGCNNVCEHPFYVTKHVVDDALKYSVCVGSLNNVMLPESDMLGGIETDGWVYIRGQFDSANKVFPKNPDGVSVLYANGNMPADTDEFGCIAICRVTNVTFNPDTAVFTQLVTGSLWGDRIKLGGDSARYFFARV